MCVCVCLCVYTFKDIFKATNMSSVSFKFICFTVQYPVCLAFAYASFSVPIPFACIFQLAYEYPYIHVLSPVLSYAWILAVTLIFMVSSVLEFAYV